MAGSPHLVPTETEAAVDRLIRLFGAVLLNEDLVDRGYALREAVEECPVDSGDELEVGLVGDWSRWGSLLRTG